MIPPATAATAAVTVVTAGQHLTMDTAHELMHLVRAVPDSAAPYVVVDMTATTALDSTGVGALVSSLRYVRQRRGALVLANLQPELRRVFRVMNILGLFDVYDSVEGAAERVSA